MMVVVVVMEAVSPACPEYELEASPVRGKMKMKVNPQQKPSGRQQS